MPKKKANTQYTQEENTGEINYLNMEKAFGAAFGGPVQPTIIFTKIRCVY